MRPNILFLPVMPAAPSGVSVCEVIKKWRKVEGSAASQAFKGNRTAWLPYLAFPSPESSPWYPSRWACERLCRNRCQRQAERAAAESAAAGGASGADPKGAELPAGECLAGRGQLGGAWLSQDVAQPGLTGKIQYRIPGDLPMAECRSERWVAVTGSIL